jgi:hypothetical protein
MYAVVGRGLDHLPLSNLWSKRNIGVSLYLIEKPVAHKLVNPVQGRTNFRIFTYPRNILDSTNMDG